MGYGDMYPVTVPGRLVAAVTMFMGLALFGMLMNIVGKAMMAALFGSESLEEDSHGHGGESKGHSEKSLPHNWNPAWRHCPTCGKEHAQSETSQ